MPRECANASMIQWPRQCGTWIKRVSLIVKFRARFIMNGKPTSALEWCLVQSLRHSNRLNNAALNVCPARWGDAVYIRTFQFGCSYLLALYNGRHMPFTLAAQLDCCFSSLPFSKKTVHKTWAWTVWENCTYFDRYAGNRFCYSCHSRPLVIPHNNTFLLPKVLPDSVCVWLTSELHSPGDSWRAFTWWPRLVPRKCSRPADSRNQGPVSD